MNKLVTITSAHHYQKPIMTLQTWPNSNALVTLRVLPATWEIMRYETYLNATREKQPTWISSLFNSNSTSLRPRVQNSSKPVTSSKYLNVNCSAACRRDSQPWFSANIRIPKQFDGSSCFSKNSEHACLTPKNNTYYQTASMMGNCKN